MPTGRNYFYELLILLDSFTFLMFVTLTVTDLSVMKVRCTEIWTNANCFGIFGLKLVIHALHA